MRELGRVLELQPGQEEKLYPSRNCGKRAENENWKSQLMHHMTGWGLTALAVEGLRHDSGSESVFIPNPEQQRTEVDDR